MKVVYEKKFILDMHEKELVNSFLQTLATAPLPCQGCKAYAYGKCIAHSIWDDLSLDETCTEYIKWREKIRGIRTKFNELEDEELKKIIESKYILNYTLQNVDKASVLHKIAETKEKSFCISRLVCFSGKNANLKWLMKQQTSSYASLLIPMNHFITRCQRNSACFSLPLPAKMTSSSLFG